MPRYLIHIGPHKTGTTYLQHAFTRLRPELAERGVIYPEQWGGRHGHHALAMAIEGCDASLPAAFEAFHRPDVQTVLLSSETLAFASDADVGRLHALLGGEPAILVFYCRRWSELIPSSWHEIVKHGSLITMPEFVLGCLSDPPASSLVNFAHVLDRYAKVFGASALRVVSYNGVLEAGQDLFTHFCRNFLSWPHPPPAGLGRVNVSLEMVDSEIIRSLNVLEWTRAREGYQRLYRYYMAAKAELPVGWVVEQSMQYVVDKIRINDASPALAQLHAGIVSRYDTALVPPHPPLGLFEPRAAEVNYIKTDYLFVDGVMEVLRGMQDSLLRASREAVAV